MLGGALLLATLMFDVFGTRGAGELSDFDFEGLVLLVRQDHAVVDQLWVDRAAQKGRNRSLSEKKKTVQFCVRGISRSEFAHKQQ